ncbi:MAG: bifunctional methylenetetrahydrofolate dehydrogenase/methenyltetrahydrofolate cyclohydrolase, partial [Methanoregula sp.]|nr:bifunctional methylenetetrahydrofolate dehydrogenase/methenyltetrahydrofolate cyclohydrolase [Methanoregula sp.]
MSTILDGKATSEKRLEHLRQEIADSRLEPRLATVIVGNDPASQMYVRMKHKACEKVGIGSVGIEMPAEATTRMVVNKVRSLNQDGTIDGILVQLPLPQQVDAERVIGAISPDKDVDGYHPENMGHLFLGKPRFSSCTPTGIMTLLSEYQIPLAGARAVIAGR